MERRIDEQATDPGDVEELGANPVLDLSLLSLEDDGADQGDREEGDEGEERGQPNFEPLPKADGRDPRPLPVTLTR